MIISNKKLFIDLKYFSSECHSLALNSEEMVNEFWKNDIFSDYGVPTDIRIPAVRRKVFRELQNQELLMLGSISEHGIRTTDLQGKPAGYSGVPPCSQTKNLSHGHPRKDLPQYIGPRQSDKRLAHLCRFRSSTHSESQTTLCQRFIWYRIGTNHLRVGFHNDRSLFVSLSMGNVPQTQGSCETAYTSRPERQHSNDSFYYQRESSRSQYPRQTVYRSRCHLHHGSRLFGLRASLQAESIVSILCYTRQEQCQISPAILSEDRQNVWTQIRPDRYAVRLLLQERLSRKAPANCLLRRKAKQESGFLDQQFHASGTNHHRDLPQTLADRVILQMDQTASANQGVLWNIRECGQNTNMDCYLRLRAGCNYQKTIESRTKPLHNFTNCQRDAFRENIAFTSAYRC